MPSRDEIFEKVRDTLVDALGLSDDEVTPQARLAADLGAESIDFLDIVFRLEKAFNIKIPRGEMFPEDIFNNPDCVKDGKVTAQGLQLMKERMPHVDLTALSAGDDIEKLHFTVDTVVNYIESKVKA